MLLKLEKSRWEYHKGFAVHVTYYLQILPPIYKMSDRSLSAYKDTSVPHGHEFCQLLKRIQMLQTITRISGI